MTTRAMSVADRRACKQEFAWANERSLADAVAEMLSLADEPRPAAEGTLPVACRRFKSRRIALGLSVSRLAALAGCGDDQIRKIESGTPPAELLAGKLLETFERFEELWGPVGTLDRVGRQAIGARRKALGLSQKRLADIAGCSLASIAVVEKGYVPQRSEVVPRVLDTLARLERGGS